MQFLKKPALSGDHRGSSNPRIEQTQNKMNLVPLYNQDHLLIRPVPGRWAMGKEFVEGILLGRDCSFGTCFLFVCGTVVEGRNDEHVPRGLESEATRQ